MTPTCTSAIPTSPTLCHAFPTVSHNIAPQLTKAAFLILDSWEPRKVSNRSMVCLINICWIDIVMLVMLVLYSVVQHFPYPTSQPLSTTGLRGNQVEN